MHWSHLTDGMAYLIDNILVGKWIDLSSIIYFFMLKAATAKHSIGSLPFPTLITKLLISEKVPFKVGAKDNHLVPSVRFSILTKMDLMDPLGGPSSKKSFTPNPTKSVAAITKATVMCLLHSFMDKVACVLKNQKRITKNQKLIATSLNSQTTDDPLQLESANESNEEVEAPLDEEYFDMPPTSTFWEDARRLDSSSDDGFGDD